MSDMVIIIGFFLLFMALVVLGLAYFGIRTVILFAKWALNELGYKKE